jgi:hypothetical protein
VSPILCYCSSSLQNQVKCRFVKRGEQFNSGWAPNTLPAAVSHACVCVRAMWKLSDNRETHSQNIYLMAAATKISLLLNDAAMMVWELGRKRAAASLWLMRNDFNGYRWRLQHGMSLTPTRYWCDCTTYKAPQTDWVHHLCAQRCKSARNFSVCSRDAQSPLLQLRVRPSRRRVLFGAQNEAIFPAETRRAAYWCMITREMRETRILHHDCCTTVLCADMGNRAFRHDYAIARGKSKAHGQIWLEDSKPHILNWTQFGWWIHFVSYATYFGCILWCNWLFYLESEI